MSYHCKRQGDLAIQCSPHYQEHGISQACVYWIPALCDWIGPVSSSLVQLGREDMCTDHTVVLGGEWLWRPCCVIVGELGEGLVGCLVSVDYIAEIRAATFAKPRQASPSSSTRHSKSKIRANLRTAPKASASAMIAPFLKNKWKWGKFWWYNHARQPRATL